MDDFLLRCPVFLSACSLRFFIIIALEQKITKTWHEKALNEDRHACTHQGCSKCFFVWEVYFKKIYFLFDGHTVWIFMLKDSCLLTCINQANHLWYFLRNFFYWSGEKSGEMIIIYIKIISFYRTLLNIVLWWLVPELDYEYTYLKLILLRNCKKNK